MGIKQKKWNDMEIKQNMKRPTSLLQFWLFKYFTEYTFGDLHEQGQESWVVDVFWEVLQQAGQRLLIAAGESSFQFVPPEEDLKWGLTESIFNHSNSVRIGYKTFYYYTFNRFLVSRRFL